MCGFQMMGTVLAARSDFPEINTQICQLKIHSAVKMFGSLRRRVKLHIGQCEVQSGNDTEPQTLH